mgnify:FL=1
MPSRRVLLSSGAGASLLGALTACAASTDSPSASRPAATQASSADDSRRRVLVIGAGAAGLAAASALSAKGLAVTVLEARDRIGGRVFTSSQWPGQPIDLGASWIHGPEGNPVTELAKEAGATTLATSYDSGEVYIAAALKAQGLREPDTDGWESKVAAALTAAAAGDGDMSIQEAIERTSWFPGLTAAERADLGFYLSATFETEYGLEAGRLSAWSTDEGKEFDGDDVLFPGGYGAVMTYLAKGIDVQLSNPVTRIRVDGGQIVATVAGREERASAVIVTVPLGVLKAGTLTIEPAMSTAAQNAISRLDMGVLSKTFLRFERAFWPTDVDWHEYLTAAPGHWSEWVSFAKTGAPILLGFNSGANARRIEAADPKVVVAEAMSALRDMFGKGIPEPNAVLTSSWSRDEWALGSYSGTVVGSGRADRLALGSPVGGLIFWAGEATEPDYPSTVHGAVLSGRRAAGEVIDLLG